jgi:hypothetical protein
MVEGSGDEFLAVARPKYCLMTQDFTGSSTSKAVQRGLMSFTATRPWWAAAICLPLVRPRY